MTSNAVNVAFKYNLQVVTYLLRGECSLKNYPYVVQQHISAPSYSVQNTPIGLGSVI